MILAGRIELLREERVPRTINNQERGRASAVTAWQLTPQRHWPRTPQSAVDLEDVLSQINSNNFPQREDNFLTSLVTISFTIDSEMWSW